MDDRATVVKYGAAVRKCLSDASVDIRNKFAFYSIRNVPLYVSRNAGTTPSVLRKNDFPT